MIRVIFCLVLISVSSLRGDSWMPARAYESVSDNKRFVATITPAKDDAKAEVKVSEVKGKQRKQLWQSKLSNRIAPTEAYVSDDGNVVVTLNNWASIGYGDDVVAIYGPEGQRAKYSLEEFAPLPVKKRERDETQFTRSLSYHDKFPHTTSSRRWDDEGIKFFASERTNSFFCVWLNWENRWAAWRLADGKLIKPTANQTRDWKVLGRQIALRELNGENPLAAAALLGKLRCKEDRHLIEAWLADPDRYSGSTYTSEPRSFALTSGSWRREKADRILAEWDQRRTNSASILHDDRTYFLGTVKGAVQFTSPPRNAEGALHIYLMPDSLPLNQMTRYRPAQYLTADLSNAGPWDHEKKQAGQLDSKINFVVKHVTPGKYLLRVIWDKSKPFCGETFPCSPQTGDFISTNSPLIQVIAGKETQNVQINCTHPAR